MKCKKCPGWEECPARNGDECVTADFQDLKKDLEMEHTLRIRLENITHEQSEILKILKKYMHVQKDFATWLTVLGCGSIGITEEEYTILKEYFKDESY